MIHNYLFIESIKKSTGFRPNIFKKLFLNNFFYLIQNNFFIFNKKLIISDLNKINLNEIYLAHLRV